MIFLFVCLFCFFLTLLFLIFHTYFKKVMHAVWLFSTCDWQFVFRVLPSLQCKLVLSFLQIWQWLGRLHFVGDSFYPKSIETSLCSYKLFTLICVFIFRQNSLPAHRFVFANSLEDRGSFLGRIILKTQKSYLMPLNSAL